MTTPEDAKEAYEVWREAMADQNISVDPWEALSAADAYAWVQVVHEVRLWGPETL
jgi:hypothetical protein